MKSQTRQKAHSLHMRTPPKHVTAPHPLHLISSLPQISDIPRQCSRIAAHINHPGRPHFYDGVQADRIASLSRRIDYDDVRMAFFLFILFRQNILGFSRKKFYIFDPVYPGVLPRVEDRLRHDLHAADLPGPLRQKQGNRPDPAVQIPYDLVSGQSRILQRGLIESYSLQGIDLVK